MRADLLHVCTAISNPVRYRSRPALYRNFAKMVQDAGANLWTIEAAFGDRDWEVTDPGNPQHVRVRTSHELWLKENMLNLLIHRLQAEAEYIAWIDADVTFLRPDWAAETVHALQHYHVVQPWSRCVDLGPRYEIVPDENGSEHLPGMVAQELNGHRWGNTPYGKHPGHCGYAWAARREAIDTLGGLIDFSICGANDHHMARGFFGDIDNSIHRASSKGLKRALHVWGERAAKLRENVGFVEGTVGHFWHGPKNKRGYKDRWKILCDSQFDPATDIARDSQGLYYLVDDGSRRIINLRNDLRAYFRSRDEDEGLLR